MAGTPKGLDFKSVMEDLQNIRGVEMVHNLHIWSLTMGTAALSVHLAIGTFNFCIKAVHGDLSCVLQESSKSSYRAREMCRFDECRYRTITVIWKR